MKVSNCTDSVDTVSIILWNYSKSNFSKVYVTRAEKRCVPSYTKYTKKKNVWSKRPTIVTQLHNEQIMTSILE